MGLSLQPPNNFDLRVLGLWMIAIIECWKHPVKRNIRCGRIFKMSVIALTFGRLKFLIKFVWRRRNLWLGLEVFSGVYNMGIGLAV
jgi:hypothetical protein